MTTKEKILITVLLAIIFSCFFGCNKPKEHFITVPALSGNVTTLKYLQQLYPLYNREYFQDRLPKDVNIELVKELPVDSRMAESGCDESGCSITFSLKYVMAPRVAELTTLHEMCHIAAWGEDLQDHGRHWRACMTKFDVQGAFRQIVIDKYSEDVK